jgi:ketosteroid isomerase-like protein
MEDNHISDPRAREFAGKLRKFEQDSDPAPLVGLFADDATVSRLDGRGDRRGEVEQFWREYRGQFREVRTTFFDVVEGMDQSALEWTSEVTMPDGRSLEYRGVTVVDYEGEQIVRLRAYYDSAALLLVPADTR